MKKNISILGAGSWGTALAFMLSNNGHHVKVWSCLKDEINMLIEHKEHKQKLPGIKLNKSIEFSSDMEYTINDTEIVLIVVPSSYVRSTVSLAKKFLTNKIIVICSKGIEEYTGYRMSQIVEEEVKNAKVVCLSGPSHAEEVAKHIPTAVVVASKDIGIAEYTQSIFMNSRFRVYTNTDIIGVELGGAVKNIIALCAGISDGLGYGDNTKAALMTRGLAETVRLGEKLGGASQTFAGLTGIGDLIVTCTSMHSRNRRAGILIGKGMSVEETLNEIKMVVEGILTAKAVNKLSQNNNIEMPITQEACKVLFDGKAPLKAVNDLMNRERKFEV